MPQPHSPAPETAAIDLHGHTVWEAEEELSLFLHHLPDEVKAVEVTHGYSRGTALKHMVRQEFHHWRVRDKRAGLNPGVTLLLLK